MRELREATSAEGLMLTAALRATPTPEQHAHLGEISDLVDWINLMS